MSLQKEIHEHNYNELKRKRIQLIQELAETEKRIKKMKIRIQDIDSKERRKFTL